MASFSGLYKDVDGQWYTYKDSSGSLVTSSDKNEIFTHLKNLYGRDDIMIVKHLDISYTDVITDPS